MQSAIPSHRTDKTDSAKVDDVADVSVRGSWLKKVVFGCAGVFGVLLLIMFLTIWVLINWLSSWDGCYVTKDGNVYWTRVIVQEGKRAEWKVEGADASSFKAFGSPNVEYGADASQVFFKGQLLRGADPATFEVVDSKNFVSRDANNEYQKSRKTRNDGEQFVRLSSMYTRDINGIYAGKSRIQNADSDSFVLIDTSEHKYSSDCFYAKDKNYVYVNGDVVIGANPTTFATLGANYATDQDNVYYREHCLENADSQTFQVVYHNRYYVVGDDGELLYQSGRLVDRLD